MVYLVRIAKPAYINYNQNQKIVSVYNNVQQGILVRMVFAPNAPLIVIHAAI